MVSTMGVISFFILGRLGQRKGRTKVQQKSQTDIVRTFYDIIFKLLKKSFKVGIPFAIDTFATFFEGSNPKIL